MENIKGWKIERKNQLNQKKTELNDLINEIALLILLMKLIHC